MRLFKKKEIYQVKSIRVDPTEMAEPTTAADFLRRGMGFYARKQYEKAEADLRKATSLDPDAKDAYYSLGMVLKAQGRKEEAVQAFQRAIDVLTADKSDVSAEMLRRLALGHINELKKGDWDLEREIWKRVS